MFVFQCTLRPSEHQKRVWTAFPVSGSGGMVRSPAGAGPVLPRLGLPEHPGRRTPGLCPSKPPPSPRSPWPSRPCRLSRHPEVVVALLREAALRLSSLWSPGLVSYRSPGILGPRRVGTGRQEVCSEPTAHGRVSSHADSGVTGCMSI